MFRIDEIVALYGIQEWNNDAMFLGVNLGNGGDAVNEFWMVDARCVGV